MDDGDKKIIDHDAAAGKAYYWANCFDKAGIDQQVNADNYG
jgi:hypothetical protein